MSIRRADEGDLEDLVALWIRMMREHEAFEPRLVLSEAAGPSYQSYLLLHVRNERSVVLVAEEDGRVLGFCCGYACRNIPMFEPGEFAYLSDIYVLPEQQGRGFGGALLEEAKARFLAMGLNTMHLQVYTRNERGRAFWRSQGFEPFFERMVLELEEDDGNG